MLRETACSFRLLLATAIVALGASWPAIAQKASSCPLKLDEQINSIRAFEKLASFVTQEPRCFNCHGGVNPHIEGVGPDPEDDNAPVSTVEHGGGRIGHDSRGTTSIAGGCLECHSDMARKRDGTKSNWMTAPPSLSFVGKDAPKLCKQFKSATGSAEHFLGHLKDDNGGNNFSGTAFMGGCGLDPVMFKKDLEIEKICRPPSIGHQALFNLGETWVKAMGGKFQGDESCGCAIELELEIEHHLADRRDTAKAKGGMALFASDVRFEARLEPHPTMPARLLAQLPVERTYSVSHITPRCAGAVDLIEIWFVDATLDADTGMLELGFEPAATSNAEGFWVCDGDKDDVGLDVFNALDEHAPYRMPANPGARQQFSIPRNDGVDETLTVTVKSGLQNP